MSGLYEGMGVFGHKPTPDEAHAKAFVMPRGIGDGFWPGYCCALADMGVPYLEVTAILYAACDGQFAHNCEPMFDDEIEEARDD